ncbi:COG4223 family protein [Actibacterium ureilyticum]|uniref:COG4223 family protein n=1 Tax=Actibacterium ureilyticum TaxID=1590614 RepID=UPI0011410343|nr:hypothetical protein [Actibacterium ureilyticum]
MTDDTPDDTPQDADAPEADATEPADDDIASDTPDTDEDESDLLTRVAPETTAEPEPQPEPVAPAPRESSGAGFGALLLGGVLAALIGLGAAKFILPQSWLTDQGDTDALRATVQAQEDRLATLSTGMSDLTQTVQDRSGTEALTAQIAEMNDALSGRLDKIAEDVAAQSIWLGEIDERLTTVEKAPLRSSNDASVAAYERELEKMRTALESQQAENDRIAADVSMMADRARSEIDAASDRAKALETRAAMLRIQAALESGGSFTSALSDLDTDVPPALSAVAQDGVAALSTLQDAFPAAARDGLQASLHATAGEDPANRVSAFLRGQFGVRSLEPREGDDPDAILSRAEATLNSGDVAGALAEIVMLPPEGQSAMTDWVTAARARLDALAAADDLAETLNIN